MRSVTIYRLMREMWTAQCTRCGGDHALSKCTWPAITTKRRKA